jgi:hypothetical protein
MLSLFLAAAIANQPPERALPTAATASAQAVVRIVRGAEVRFGNSEVLEASISRASTVRERDGSTRTASLIEFY